MELVKPASKSSPSSSSSGSTATKLTAAAATPTTAPPHSDKASEALPKIKVTGHELFEFNIADCYSFRNFTIRFGFWEKIDSANNLSKVSLYSIL